MTLWRNGCRLKAAKREGGLRKILMLCRATLVESARNRRLGSDYDGQIRDGKNLIVYKRRLDSMRVPVTTVRVVVSGRRSLDEGKGVVLRER